MKMYTDEKKIQGLQRMILFVKIFRNIKHFVFRPLLGYYHSGVITQFRELPKLCYHPWMAADEDMVSHMLSHV